jgi:hypothetical protein
MRDFLRAKSGSSSYPADHLLSNTVHMRGLSHVETFSASGEISVIERITIRSRQAVIRLIMSVNAEDLKSCLQLDDSVTDQFSITKMCDSYSIQLFSLRNCLTYLENDGTNGLMFVLPFALQEGVLPNSHPTH